MDQWRACGGPRPTRERRYDREPKRHHLLFCRHRYGNDRRGGGLAGHPAAGTHTPRGQIRGQRRHARPTTARTWRRAAKRCAGWLAGGQGGPGGASCVRRGGQKSINQEKTTVCRELQALRDGSVRHRLARDNCCYREPICQFPRFRPATRKTARLDPVIVNPSGIQFNSLNRSRFVPPQSVSCVVRAPHARTPALRRATNLARDNFLWKTAPWHDSCRLDGAGGWRGYAE